MTLAPVSDSDEEFLSAHETESQGDDDDDSIMEPPVHPLPSMQGAFEESILESTEDDEVAVPSAGLDAQGRRHRLLEAHQYDESWTSKWKQRATAQHHPLMKLMSQIVFGMHLLQQSQAKSNEEVVRILQTHVNEVDGFLERTLEDFGLADADIKDRVQHLKLPMEHLEVFNSMLDDRSFRTQLLEGNEKIEKIIDRTAKARNTANKDLQEGMKATQELGRYLSEVKDRWPLDNSDITGVYGAMRGNEIGWTKYLKTLRAKSDELERDLIHLGTLIGEMSRLAAAASRRSIPSRRTTSPSRSARSLPATSALRSKFAWDDTPPMPSTPLALNKPLPMKPSTIPELPILKKAKPHPVPFSERYEKPRQSPAPGGRRVASMPDRSLPTRPKTAGAARDACQTEQSTLELAEFLRTSGPLRSNPPEHSEADAGNRAVRAKSLGASDLMSSAAEAKAVVARSKSHGAAVILTERGKGRPVSRGADKGESDRSRSAPRKDSMSGGFTRRISTRIKNFRPVLDDKPRVNSIAEAPVDSAYSSSAENQTPPTDISRSHAAALQTPRSQAGQSQPRLGLFPRSATLPSSSMQKTSTANTDGRVSADRRRPSLKTSSGSNRAPKPRALSLREIFHRRNKAQMTD